MMFFPLNKDRATGLVHKDKTCMHAQTSVSLSLSSDLFAIARERIANDQGTGPGFSELREDRVYPLGFYAEGFGLGFSSLFSFFGLVMPRQQGRGVVRSGNFVSL